MGNLPLLLSAPSSSVPNVPELVERKHEREAGIISEKDELRYLADLGRLAEALEESSFHSVLPPEAPNRDTLESFVIEERLRV
jgi:hypothetical protein